AGGARPSGSCAASPKQRRSSVVCSEHESREVHAGKAQGTSAPDRARKVDREGRGLIVAYLCSSL
ncbi:unnamed protein product, partial [Urochloa humidicola]